MPNRLVRIVGEPDVFEVLAETPTTLLLVNPTARLRLTVAALEEELSNVRSTLERNARALDRKASASS